MELNINELNRKIEEHFAHLTNEQLEENLKRAGIEVYTDMELNFLDHERPFQTNPELPIFLAREANADSW